MAKCTVKDEPTYVLELNKLEAETLYRLIGWHVDGYGLMDVVGGIYAALNWYEFNDSPIKCRGDADIVTITEELPK